MQFAWLVDQTQVTCSRFHMYVRHDVTDNSTLVAKFITSFPAYSSLVRSQPRLLLVSPTLAFVPPPLPQDHIELSTTVSLLLADLTVVCCPMGVVRAVGSGNCPGVVGVALPHPSSVCVSCPPSTAPRCALCSLPPPPHTHISCCLSARLGTRCACLEPAVS